MALEPRLHELPERNTVRPFTAQTQQQIARDHDRVPHSSYAQRPGPLKFNALQPRSRLTVTLRSRSGELQIPAARHRYYRCAELAWPNPNIENFE